jgi:hypothetical protein
MSTKDADILFLRSDRKVPPQLAELTGQPFKTQMRGAKKASAIALAGRDQTKILERQMVETINKIDVGLSKRFNPKLIPLKSSRQAATF